MIAQLIAWFKRQDAVACPAPPLPLERPPLDRLAAQPELVPTRVAEDAVAQKYLTLLGQLPWSDFPERPPRRPRGGPWPGPAPAPRAPFVAAYLVKLHEQLSSMGRLRTYLIEHPALVWLLGFPLVPAPDSPWGFDVAASVPSRKQLGRVLRELSNDALQFLLDGSVQLIYDALPPDEQATFGDVVSGDTKAILAWVKENNPKVFIKEGRFDKTRQPAGDPDCKLGVKKKRNRTPEPATPPATPAAEAAPASNLQIGVDILWGYASGILVTKVGDWGEVVLAERTRPFNESDVSYFLPLMADAERRLGKKPRFGAFDGAFDAHYVHAYFAGRGGFAAVPWADSHAPPIFQDDTQRQPLCEADLPMVQQFTYRDNTSSAVPRQRAKYRCPLLATADGAGGGDCPIAHPKWADGGCVKTIGVGPGEFERYTLDRKSDEYKRIYNQRSADERVNSLAKDLGIERPKLRNQRSIANHNTLLYVLLNLRAWQRIQARRAHAACPEVTPSPAS